MTSPLNAATTQATRTETTESSLPGNPYRSVRSPLQIAQAVPMTAEDQRRVEQHRAEVRAILNGEDDRCLVILGPCSIHDADSAYEYARRLLRLQSQVSDRLLLVMRTYFEKPRTTVGWKGYAFDPALDGSHNMDQGLEQSRQLLAAISRLGLPLATEALSPLIADYLQDWISWTAIGARTTESQTHREMASGLQSAVGFKNATDGGIQVAIDAIRSAAHPHDYLGIDHEGRVAIRQTLGNSDGHLVLRGAKGRPNYDAASVAASRERMQAAGLKARILVDCSHDNSGKDYRQQPQVLRAVVEQISAGQTGLVGVMLESHIKDGQQSLSGCPTQLDPQQSVTDGCLGWESTESLILEMHQRLASR